VSGFRNLPKVDALAASDMLAAYPERVRVSAARAAVDRLREALRNGQAPDLQNPEVLALAEAKRLSRPSLRRVINLSGVVLHTGLGRARLAASVAEEVAQVAAAHSAVELDLDTGKRGDRQSHVREHLRELTGAEAAFVVNNAAAGVLLSLTALCAGRPVVLSRGQMVEIGGQFRMPDVVRQSGCQLVEIGCTNKTHLGDYEQALSAHAEASGAILRCHPSNYKIVGFTSEPAPEDLARLAHERGWLMIDDVGSGCLLDTTQYGLPREQTMQEALASGADVVIASGDKMLGGGQAGLIVGSAAAIDRIRRHPLARAVRIDKLSMAALEATLRLYRHGRHHEIPTWAALGRDLDQVRALAERLAAARPGSEVAEGRTEVGGGSAPGASVPTWRVALEGNADELARALRVLDTPIVGRIEDGRLWLDPRTLEDDEVAEVEEALGRL